MVLIIGIMTQFRNKKIIDSKKLGKVINLRGVYGKSYLTPKINGSNKKKKTF